MGDQRRSAVRLLIVVVALFARAGTAHAQAIYRVGPVQPINAPTASSESSPRLDCSSTGSFVAAWMSPDSDDWGVRARTFTAQGTPVSAELPVNTVTTGAQDFPAVARDGAGNFAVAWRDWTAEGGGNGIGVRARLFTAAGSGSDEFSVNSHLPLSQLFPSIARSPAGSFVVAWHGIGPGGLLGVWFRRFDAAGVPQGVETYVDYGQYIRVAHDPATGGYIFAWEHYNGTDFDVRARRYDGLGNPLGDILEVNTSTLGDQRAPKIDIAPDGSFVIVYEGEGQGDVEGILGQRFDGSGAPLGTEFWVNATIDLAQWGAAVRQDAAHGFLVLWASEQPGGAFRILSAYFSALGTRVTSGDLPVTASLAAGHSQFGVPDLCRFDTSSFRAIFRQSAGSAEIYGQRLVVALFADGFEAADTSAWSSTAP